MTGYMTLSGRPCHVEELSSDEREALSKVLDRLSGGGSWASFSAAWPAIVRRHMGENKFAKAAQDANLAYRLCQDLEARIGIAEERVAPEGYRDILADWIEERFRSRYAFCKEAGMDEGHLSRVLSGRKDLSMESFENALGVLGRRIATKPDVDRRQELSQVVRHLRSALRKDKGRRREIGLRRLLPPDGPRMKLTRMPA